VNKLNNVSVTYLKIPKKHRGPHKVPSRATCGPRVWDHWFSLWRSASNPSRRAGVNQPPHTKPCSLILKLSLC